MLTLPTPRPVFSNSCPRCGQGAIFRGIYAMNDRCPACGYAYEKEPGYFLGAMIAAYFIGAFSLVPTLALGLFVWNLELVPMLALGIGQILALHPFLYRYSRLAWISIETRMTGTLDRGKGR